MKLDTLHDVMSALDSANVRVLVAGGLAVVAHGHVRATENLDLVVDPDSANVERFFGVLRQFRYDPRAFVRLSDFASLSVREAWILKKTTPVLPLSSPSFSDLDINWLLDLPVPFTQAWNEALESEIVPGLSCRFVSLPLLLAMKRSTGRVIDGLDVLALEELSLWEMTSPTL